MANLNGADHVGSPAVAYGKVYVGSFRPEPLLLGRPNRKHRLEIPNKLDMIRSSPAVTNGKVYTGADDGNVYCLDANTGALIWNTAPAQDRSFREQNWRSPFIIRSSSPTVANGMVYIGHMDSYVYCLNANTGALVWKYKTGGAVASTPTVYNGKVLRRIKRQFHVLLKRNKRKAHLEV